MGIYLKIFCNLEDKVLKELEKHLKETFLLKVKAEILNENFDFALNGERGQYLSSLILNKLSKSKKDSDKWLAIFDFDLYCPGLNFIFGQADLNSQIAIISLKRLKQEFYGLPKNENLFIERIKKEATHEIGHLFYLDHCQDRKCVMHFSNSLFDTDFKSFKFCQKCKRILQSYLERK